MKVKTHRPAVTIHVLKWIVVLLISTLRLPSFAQTKGLKLVITPKAPAENVIAFAEEHNTGPGNTSLAFDAADTYKWSGPSPYTKESWGYYTTENKEVPYIKRDRDLGQTFTYKEHVPKKLFAVTISTGYGSNVVRPGMYGQNVSLQLFEVSGTPALNNNGSDSTIEAYHGFPHNRPVDSIWAIRDDYYEGEVYTSLAVFTGATFPTKKDFGFADSEQISPDHPALKGKLLQFILPEKKTITLQPGMRYAFLIMIDKMGPDRGFTLATSTYGKYLDGHGIRRDGNGKFPPVPADPSKDFRDPANKKAYQSAHFPAGMNERIKIPPGTNGYPDVDTWRDFEFYIQTD